MTFIGFPCFSKCIICTNWHIYIKSAGNNIEWLKYFGKYSVSVDEHDIYAIIKFDVILIPNYLLKYNVSCGINSGSVY